MNKINGDSMKQKRSIGLLKILFSMGLISLVTQVEGVATGVTPAVPTNAKIQVPAAPTAAAGAAAAGPTSKAAAAKVVGSGDGNKERAQTKQGEASRVANTSQDKAPGGASGGNASQDKAPGGASGGAKVESKDKASGGANVIQDKAAVKPGEGGTGMAAGSTTAKPAVDTNNKLAATTPAQQQVPAGGATVTAQSQASTPVGAASRGSSVASGVVAPGMESINPADLNKTLLKNQKTIDALKKLLDQARTRLEKLEASEKTLTQQITEVENNTGSTAESAALEKERLDVERAREDLNKLQTQREEIDRKIAELTETLKTEEQQQKALVDKVALDKQEKLKSVNIDMQKLATNVSILEKGMDELNKAVTSDTIIN